MKRAIFLVCISFGLYSFGVLVPRSSSAPPSGYNGEFGFYCTACHSSYALNSGGGSVFASGLPNTSYQKATDYPFTLTITHGTADRTRWGFEIAARNLLGQPIGTFTAGPNTTVVNTAELGHQGAVLTAPSDSYTYTGLIWTSPAVPTPDDAAVNFYIVGNASNANSNTDGDYIYSNITTITLPLRLGYFRVQVLDDYKAQLQWQTLQETNTASFVIERSTDGLGFTAIDSVRAAGHSTTTRAYAYTDAWPRVFDKNVFYRLKQTDIDGRFTYSAVVKLTLKNPGTYIRNIAPNPVSWGQPFYAEVVSTERQDASLMLMDMQGRTLYMQKALLWKGVNVINMNPLATMPAGHYFIALRGKNFQQRVSLVVQ
jgi:hypothetical protein